jgi:hypothetical protein
MTATKYLKKTACKDPVSTTRECVLTIDDAAHILDNYNDTNRPLSKSLAKLYSLEFLRGEWKFNGENIIFATDSEGNEHLVSGQHRLLALIMAAERYHSSPSEWPSAQLEMRVNITTGIPLETADSVDTGKPRNHTDVLFRSELVDNHISEDWNASAAKRKKWCRTLATAARVVWQRQGGKTVSSAEKFVTSEMLLFIEQEHIDLCKFVTMVMDADAGDGGHGGLTKVSHAYMAAFCYMATLTDERVVDEDIKDKVENFLDQVAQGTGFSSGDPAHAITGYWNSLPPGSKDRDTEVCGPLVKCLNALIDGSKVTPSKLKLSKKELDTYRTNPPLLTGWDTAAFEYAAEVKAEAAIAQEEAVAEAAAEAAEDVVEVTEEAVSTVKRKPKKKAAKKKPVVLDPQDIPEVDEWE